MKSGIRTLALVLVAVMAFGSTALAGEKPKGESAKHKDVRMLLELTGAGKMGVQVANQMLASFKKSMKNVPAEFWDEFSKEMRPEDLTDMVVPIYAKHLTHGEIKELVRFYKTPVGKKLIRVQPQIMQESMKAGEIWGKEIANKVINKLKEKGYR